MYKNQALIDKQDNNDNLSSDDNSSSSSEDSSSSSDEDLNEMIFESMDKLKEEILNNKFDEDQKTDILETLNNYLKNNWEINKNLLKYLFLGWAVNDKLNEVKENNSKDSKYYEQQTNSEL